jgi:hypothetical protein
MSARICECGRSIILKSNRRRSRPRYRLIKGHELCRKCNESLKDRIWSRWTAERTRTALTNAAVLRQPQRQHESAEDRAREREQTVQARTVWNN